MIIKSITRFFKMEAAAGIVLFLAAVLAVVIKNSQLSFWYDNLLALRTGFQIGDFALYKELILWVNDGLMAVFFFLIGLEIKREFIDGELSSRDQAILPAIAAVGGMVGPALVFLLITMDTPSVWKGWAIPCATDIAFSLGILALLGSRAPLPLKVFLTALAIIDDLGAILIIAFVYTSDLKIDYLLYSAVVCAVLYILSKAKVLNKSPYILLGIVLWYFVLKSGVHATIAGVLAALFIPYKVSDQSPLMELEHTLHNWVAFLVLPIFAFFNAGVSLDGMTFGDLFSSLTLGIALGLFLGKQIGVMLFAWLTVKAGWAKLPSNTNWVQLYSVAILTGVGFTMSLFIENLAFTDPALEIPARLGILSGSLLSGICGYLIIRFTCQAASSRIENN